MNTPKTLLEAVRYFSDLQTAHDYLTKLRYPDGVIGCPSCGNTEHYFLKTQMRWKCKLCKRQFSIKVGTIFEDSPIKLDKWLTAVWLISNSKNGISSCELARSLGVTQKTAWFMNHRIREAMANGSIEKLSGEVEADETYIGGKAQNMHYAKRQALGELSGGFGKAIVVGVIERGGKGVFEVIRKTDGKTIKPIIYANVETGSSIFTDFHGAYHGLYKNYNHGVVDHGYAYVFGPIHTNTCEAFWSLLKRSMRGTYVSVEPIHLHRYLGEYSFRYNERAGKDGDRFQKAVSQVSGKRLTYARLIGKESTTSAITA